MANEKKGFFERLAGLVSGGGAEKGVTLSSPLAGKVVPLDGVKDEAFSSGVLGKGVAIVPEKGVLVSPCDGVIDSIPDTRHAVTIVADCGAEVLIHIGMDTVSLAGSPFTALVKDGQRVTKGQPLVEFDIGAIEKAGLETVTPVVVVNSDTYSAVVPTSAARVLPGDSLLTLRS